MNVNGSHVKEFLTWFGVVAAVLNLAFTGGVLYQRIVYLETVQGELKAADAKLEGKLAGNDQQFTAILVALAKIEARLDPTASRDGRGARR